MTNASIHRAMQVYLPRNMNAFAVVLARLNISSLGQANTVLEYNLKQSFFSSVCRLHFPKLYLFLNVPLQDRTSRHCLGTFTADKPSPSPLRPRQMQCLSILSLNLFFCLT
jgi:hypothetical protein